MNRLALAAALAFAAAGPARAAESREAFEARIGAELGRSDPEAARIFSRAATAFDAKKYSEAARLYAEVESRVPSFSHAARRRCRSESELGHHAEAETICRRALELERSAQNLEALAQVLAVNRPHPFPGQIREAKKLIQEAVALDREDPGIQTVSCEIALAAEDREMLQGCTRELERLLPDSLQASYFEFFLAILDREPSRAREMLDKAHARGLPDDAYRNLQKLAQKVAASGPFLDGSHPEPDEGGTASSGTELWGYLPLLLGGWAAGFVLLVLLGWVLSKMALRAAERPVTTGKAAGLSRMVRLTYAAVLWCASAFYYLSLPIVLAAVLAAGGGIIYLFFALGRIPVKLLLIVAVLVLATVWAVLRSLFVRVKEVDPGMVLDLARQPRLAAVLGEVARKVGTRPVDRVFLTAGTELAVFERGGLLRQLGRRRERCLMLGTGLLEGFPLSAFKSVLAHEYGHFSNQDTAGGGFALAVRRSLLIMARGLAQGGAAVWYNPMWLFLNGFYRIFLRISQGASRLQEVLADRWAALCYGAASFDEGLRFVIERSVRFGFHANAAIREAVESGRPLANLYRHQPLEPPAEAEIAKALQEALDEPPSPYDSHPSPRQRFAYVRALPARSGPASLSDRETVWDLFEGREELERRMTAEIRDNVRASAGVTFALE